MSDFWNQRFSQPGYTYGTEPNAFLVSQKNYLKPGMKALAVADGEGRNGVWLAQQGLEVLSVDGSEVGLRKTQELAKSRGVVIHTELAELTKWIWPENEFDLVVAIFIHFPPEHRARMHEKMLGALKPGGLLLLEAFTPEQLEYKTGGPPVAEMLYTAGMLRDDFKAGEVLRLEEALTDLQEGPGHSGRAAVARLVLQKIPLPGS
jgi:cyclopropane fatty-acyl-phospholipid synthase-like methyltransferase